MKILLNIVQFQSKNTHFLNELINEYKNFDHKIKKNKIIDNFFERRIYKYIDNN